MKTYFQKLLRRSLYHKAYSRAFYTLWGTCIQEVKGAFRQFFTFRFPLRSPLHVLGVLSSSAWRLLLGRSLKYSFAFTGEDRIIEGILKPIVHRSGTYVDVGCNHPKFLSNTYGLYRKGWRGVCIDANESLIRKYAVLRPRDIAVTAVVSNQEKEVDFFEIENDVLSTLEHANLEDSKAQGLEHTSMKRTTETLTTILDRHSFNRTFDLLSIDAEEHDFEVLSSLDFSRYQPKLIVVEDESFEFEKQDTNRFVLFMKEKGYDLTAHVLTNSYFLKRAH